MSLYPCPGKKRVADGRLWYVPYGKQSTECTYCQECYETYIKGTPKDQGFSVKTNLYDCNCDYPKDLGKNCFKQNDIKVSIVDAVTYDAYKVSGSKKVVVPVNKKYIICVENVNRAIDSYFIIDECIVDRKRVNLDSDYIKNDVEIGGYGSDSFFIMRDDCCIKLKVIIKRKVSDYKNFGLKSNACSESIYDDVDCVRFDIKLVN